MNNFEKLQSMSTEEFSAWLNQNGMWDNSPWSIWLDQKYCQNCEEVICKSPDDSRNYICSYCEIYDKCRFFPEHEDVPDGKEIIKMWLESEVC